MLSVLWGWGIDKKTPDIYDWIGAAICLVGVSVMLLAPRHLKRRDDEYLDIQARHWVSPPLVMHLSLYKVHRLKKLWLH